MGTLDGVIDTVSVNHAIAHWQSIADEVKEEKDTFKGSAKCKGSVDHDQKVKRWLSSIDNKNNDLDPSKLQSLPEAQKKSIGYVKHSSSWYTTFHFKLKTTMTMWALFVDIGSASITRKIHSTTLSNFCLTESILFNCNFLTIKNYLKLYTSQVYLTCVK